MAQVQTPYGQVGLRPIQRVGIPSRDFQGGHGMGLLPLDPQAGYVHTGADPLTAGGTTGLGADPQTGNVYGVDPQTGTGGPGLQSPHPLTPGAKGGKPQGQPSPLDPTYYQNVADYLFKTNNSIADQQQGISDNRTALARALADLEYARPRAALSLEQQANQLGSLYSSAYGQSQGNLQTQYAGKETGLANTSGGQIAALIRGIAGLRGSIPLYKNSQALASALRLAAAAAKNPALGESAYPSGADVQTFGGSSISGAGGGGGAPHDVQTAGGLGGGRADALRGGRLSRPDLIRLALARGLR